jgi:Fe-S-cluster containining protein
MIENLKDAAYLLAVAILLVNLPQAWTSIRLYLKRGRFSCMMCGTCCRFRVIPLTKEDVRRLESGGHRDFTTKKGELCLKRAMGRCVFSKDDKCSVYELRPAVCREFPFFKVYGIGYAEKASFCPAMEKLKDG